jgi:putative DNA primase/helicase
MSALRNELAEKAILGGILLNNEACAEALQLGLKPSDFSLDSHQRIFARMKAMIESDRPVDNVTLIGELQAHKELEAVGGAAYLVDLLVGLPDRPSIASYVNILRDAAARRSVVQKVRAVERAVSDLSVPTGSLAELTTGIAQFHAGIVQPPQFSEDALALRFSNKYADDLRYVHSWGKWMQWEGNRWVEDKTLHIFDHARSICREASAECGDSRKLQAKRVASRAVSASVERLAASDRRHAADSEQWDKDPMLLNTPPGTIDLYSGKVRPHRREDYLTKMTTVGPGGDCVLWYQFLDRVTGGDSELQSYLQRVVGYSLTGITRDQVFFFLYGTGANGKSIFSTTISTLLGDYAKTAPVSSFTATKTEQHPTDLAGLRGARLVTAIETEEGTRWAESKIKAFSGGDKVTARFMRGDYFEFQPEAKLLIVGNNQPGLRSADEALRRRLQLIPFTVTIPEGERDPFLQEKLLEELPGILSWAIQGCLAWQHQTLNPPAAVRKATAEYFAEQDLIGRWIEERCRLDRACWTSSASLFADWRRWSEANGETMHSPRWFAHELESHGIKPQRKSSARGFTGIGLQQISVTQVTH